MRKACSTLALLATLLVPAQASAGTHWASPKVRWGPWHDLGSVFVTGYTENNWTASGVWSGWHQCAVDTRYIPFGAQVRVQGLWTCLATDRGGAIIGPHRLDLWVPTVSAAMPPAATLSAHRRR